MFCQAFIVSHNLLVSWTMFFVNLELLMNDILNAEWGLLRLGAEVGAWSNLDIVWWSLVCQICRKPVIFSRGRTLLEAPKKLVYRAETSSQPVLFWYKKIHFFSKKIPYLCSSEADVLFVLFYSCRKWGAIQWKQFNLSCYTTLLKGLQLPRLPSTGQTIRQKARVIC